MQDNRQRSRKEHAEKPLVKTIIHARIENVRKQALFKTVLFAVAFSVIAFAARVFAYAQLPEQSVFYLQLAEVGVIGYFAIRISGELATKLLNGHHPESQARSARSIIRIGGLLIILAVVAIMLARDPYVTLAVTTISGIALAISIQNVIGNAIAGMVLAIVRPFKIGDTITVFGITGTVRDIGLLYVRLATLQDKKAVLVPNGTMLGTAIVKERVQV
jgi:small-conductance mechanosensitive channel